VNQPEAGWVTIALLGKPRGNRGEITALALSSKPERFESLQTVHLFGARSGAPDGPAEVESTWFHSGTLIFKFKGIDTISDAETLAGAEVRIPFEDRAPLEPEEFYQSDLIGCVVVERATGESLGTVTDWQDGGGSGLLVVGDGFLIPFVRSICVEIDPGSKRIAVELPEGLKDLNRP
jgi:16S rRNA processing protein RimM